MTSPGKTYMSNITKANSNPEQEWRSFEKEQKILKYHSGKDKNPTPHNSKTERSNRMMEIENQLSSSNNLKVGEKSAYELMKNLLKSSSDDTIKLTSRETQENLAYILTNEYKRNNYINQLSEQANYLDANTSKNYHLLILLLDQVAKNKFKVIMKSKQMEIQFDNSVIKQQQELIDKLERQKIRRQKQEVSIIDDYENIIANLNKITEKLIQKQELTHKRYQQ